VRRSGYFVVITVALGLLSGATDSLCQSQQPERQALPTLTKAHDAHSLTSEQAARSYPVHLRGVVTYYDPYIDPPYPTLWVSDSSGGIYVVLSSLEAVISFIGVDLDRRLLRLDRLDIAHRDVRVQLPEM
jgi:hypothetical protein